MDIVSFLILLCPYKEHPLVGPLCGKPMMRGLFRLLPVTLFASRDFVIANNLTQHERVKLPLPIYGWIQLFSRKTCNNTIL